MIKIEILCPVPTKEDLIEILEDMAAVLKKQDCSIRVGEDGKVVWSISGEEIKTIT